MSCEAVFALGKDTKVSGTLNYAFKGGDITITFVKDNNELVADKLTRYTTISIGENDPLTLKLEGEGMSRIITFMNETDSTNFWEFLQSHATISQLPGNERAFSMIPEQSHGLSAYIPTTVGAVGRKLINHTYNAVKMIVGGEDGNESEEGKQDHPNGFILGTVTRSLADAEFSEFDPSNPNTRFSCTNITPAQIMQLWTQKFASSAGSLSDYKLICKQWKTVTQNEWNHAFTLRSFVVHAESAIKKSSLAQKPYDLLAFDILMSLFAFSFMKIEFRQEFMAVLEVIIPIFIKDTDSNKFETHAGESLSFEEAASMLFWVFKGFSEAFLIPGPRKAIPDAGKLFLQVCAELDNISPSTKAMLDAKKINSAEFCMKDVNSLFTRTRKPEDAQLYLTALISCDNVPQFVKYTVSVILVLLEDELRKVPDDEHLSFQKMFDRLLPTVDLRLILFNVENQNQTKTTC